MNIEKNSTYTALVETGGGPMKVIGFIDQENINKYKGNAPDAHDPDVIKVKFLRHITTNDHGIAFSELFPYSQEHEYELSKSKIMTVAKVSSTLAAVFTDYAHKHTNFLSERNIPYYNSSANYSVSELN